MGHGEGRWRLWHLAALVAFSAVVFSLLRTIEGLIILTLSVPAIPSILMMIRVYRSVLADDRRQRQRFGSEHGTNVEPSGCAIHGFAAIVACLAGWVIYVALGALIGFVLLAMAGVFHLVSG